MISKIAAVVGVVAAILFVAVLIGAIAFAFQPLPSHRGRIVIPGLIASSDARFDRRGIPHVRAVLELDAWRVMGFIHAADRMFQMELRRRAAHGRLAEVFGHAAIALDREARLNGYTALARRDWDQLGEGERATLSAYADGVNAFLADHPLPLELRALSLTPEPWTPIDSLAFERLLQDDLSVADSVERGAWGDARARGLDAAVALLDAGEPGTTTVAPETASVLASLTASARAVDTAAEAAPAGSNAWALGGTHTASGKPLLAGDPHLGAERPGVWYAAHVQSADGLNVVGLTLAGVPGVISGHNGRVAWSLTMHQADDSDLFVEQVDWAAGTYRRDGAWVPLDRTKETIAVKDEADVVLDVDRTVHGPIVLRVNENPGFALSREFAPADLPQGPQAFLAAARARDGGELMAAWSHFLGPSVNVCWADAAGAIGVNVAGAIPRRASGDGRFPVPGWLSVYDWGGMIPVPSLPSVATPEGGVVVTANDDWSVSSRVPPYPGYFAASDRAGRARELGSALRGATVADMRVMQNDVYSPYAAHIVSVLTRLPLADPAASRAVSILSRWGARADTRGPSRLFYAFLKALRKDVGGNELRVTWAMLERMIDGSAAQSFWDDPATPRVETRVGRIETALATALASVSREDGPEPARWSFGRAHTLEYAHPFATALPASIARRLAIGPVGLPGEWHTLNVAGFSLRGNRYDVTHIPSARLIVDLNDFDASRLVLPLGQSGQLFDRHGSDQLRAWSTGEDFPLPFTPKAVETATISTLRFVSAD